MSTVNELVAGLRVYGDFLSMHPALSPAPMTEPLSAWRLGGLGS